MESFLHGEPSFTCHKLIVAGDVLPLAPRSPTSTKRRTTLEFIVREILGSRPGEPKGASSLTRIP